MTNEQKAAALHLSCVVGHIDAVMSMLKPKSAGWNKLNNLMESANKSVDFFRIEAWDPQDMHNAGQVLDVSNEMIGGFYPHD